MIVCDRCRAEIYRPNDYTKRTVIIYEQAGCYIGNRVDLCDDCLRKRERIVNKAESYFMVNKDDPEDIFENVKYWSGM